MVPYAIRAVPFSREVLDDLDAADRLIAALPAHPDEDGHQRIRDREPEWSCHVVARVFALQRKDWNVSDGFYLRRGTEHSWLWRWIDGESVAILDIYPVAGTRPVLLDGSRHSPVNDAYITSPTAYRPDTTALWDRLAKAAASTLAE